MRITTLLVASVLLIAIFTSPAHANGEGPPTFEDRPRVGQPLRFTDAAGQVFYPERLAILTTQASAHATRIPATSNHAYVDSAPLLQP